MAIRVALVDDDQDIHKVVTALCRTSHDILLVGQALHGEDALELCGSVRPNVMLIDVVMPGIGGVETTSQVTAAYPAVKVLALSSFYEYEYILQMLEAGAVGYIVKSTLATDLIPAIHTAQSGSTILSRDAATTLISRDEQSAKMNFGLTDRELEVLAQMGKGLTDSQIAHNLDISVSTIRFHQNNILQKMDVSTRSQALVLAARQGLI